MLEKIEDEMFLSLDRILMPMKDGGILPIHQVLLALFRFTGEQREMCRVLLSPNGDMNFLHRLNEVVREKCRSAWQSFHGEGAGEEEFDYYYSFAVFGCAGLIRAWVNRDCKEPAEEMADLAENLLRRGGLSAAEGGGERAFF